MSDARVVRLSNLLKRGRQLHWRNAVKIGKQHFAARQWPQNPTGLTDLVYQGMQLLMATQFIEQRGYLPQRALDRFGAELFEEVAGNNLARVHGLVTNYAAAFADEQRLVQVACADLCHAMTGGAAAADVQKLAGTPRAVLKTTHLYCAQVFNDGAVVRALS